jgi:flagellar assembly factor FliW
MIKSILIVLIQSPLCRHDSSVEYWPIVYNYNKTITGSVTIKDEAIYEIFHPIFQISFYNSDI